ncbi:MAG: aldehyde dehydrogenase family protein [Myxococcota bacterium]
MEEPRGSFIDNQWIRPRSPDGTVRSVDPATDGEAVFEAPTSTDHAAEAVRAAADAWHDWSALSAEERMGALRRFARELEPRVESLARAVTREMGKSLRESRAEARSLLARIEMVAEQQLPRVRPWTAPGVNGECRYHPLGVVGVIGPFNFPLHLVHSHVIPALATGNTVVIKPSERTPLAAQRYVEAFEAAGLPPVLQMVQGGGDVGRALTSAPGLKGLAFTGSWPTGHAIERALLDRPEVLVALEMGGQNMSIVLDDADLDQALEGVLLGGYLTTGQRCTCTSRVLVQRSVAEGFVERLVAAARSLTWGDPADDVFMGPLASVADRDAVDALCRAGVEAGAEVLLEGVRRDGGAWRGPSIHRIAADHDSDYTREEVFGPDLAVTVVEDLDEAIGIVNGSEYGLSISIFSGRRAAFEAVYHRTRVGCVNWNRSTNRASGAFPFGGVGRSGNYRPAGGGAVFYTTYPVQVQWNEPGRLEGAPHIREALAGSDPVAALETRHRFEEVCEPYGLYPALEDHGVRIPVAQLDPEEGEELAKALVEGLASRHVEASIHRDAVRAVLPAGDVAARETAEALADALQAIRPLHPARFLARYPEGSHVPAGDDGPALPRSRDLMARLIAGDFVPDDKKPPVLDLFRSSGPYLASVDDDPLVLLDAAGQIATHAGGLNPPEILAALWKGEFGLRPLVNPDTRYEGTPELARLANILRRGTDNALPHVEFCGSGAEANEIALRTAARRRPGRRAVVAFEGAFHGRTMLALHATWNPAKRLRFEIEGHQARWVPWPAADARALEETGAEEIDLAGWDARRPDGDHPLPPDADDLEIREWESLQRVEAAFRDDQAVALLVEPMQSEGGEHHVTGRFMARLRALALAWGVPFVVDEVQTGFGLGGPFFWHRRFSLPEPPDLVTVAKKAQVGGVLSRWPLDHRGEAHITSAVRGALQAEIMAGGDAAACEHAVRDRLRDLAERHPETVRSPRVAGWSFGFDLPSPDAVKHLVAQRMWRGWMLYGAGSSAVRFRLHPHVSERALDAVFDRLDRSLALLESGEEPDPRPEPPPDDITPRLPARAGLPEGYTLHAVDMDMWPTVRPAVEQLQKVCYEDARRDDLGFFGALVDDPDAICFALVQGAEPPPEGRLVGTALAFPLEHFDHLDGPSDDTNLGAGNTLYSADVTVHPEHRGRGLGAALKQAQIRAAMEARDAHGRHRYLFVTGRNRLDATLEMQRLNARFGAFEVARYGEQYGEPGAEAAYYRIPLTAPRLPHHPRPRPPHDSLDLITGLSRPLGPLRPGAPGTEELLAPYQAGAMNGAVVNKLSLCNFVTPGVVRAFETLRALAPRRLRHLVTASGRAETCDKGLRALKFHRPGGAVAIAVGPVQAGDTTAAARSLSLAADDPDNWFGWPTTADPTLDPDRALDDLRRHIAEAGAEGVLGVVVEPVFARTGRAVPADFWSSLRSLLTEHDVPLVLMENTTAGFRSGRGMWRSDTLPVQADAVWWYPGGQQGLVFLSDRYHVPDKLTLISTWDGDEVSLTRLRWQLRAARRLPVAAVASRLEAILSGLGEVDGEGLYRAVRTPHAERVRRRLAGYGVRVDLTGDGALLVVPPLNLTEADLDRLEAAVDAVRAT